LQKNPKLCQNEHGVHQFNGKPLGLRGALLYKKNPELLVIVPYSVNFVKKTLNFVKMILKSINFMKNPLNFSVIDQYSVDAKFTK